MSVEKMSVSMPEWLHNEVRDDAAHRGETLSHWLSDAAQSKLRERSLDHFLETWEVENGPLTSEELERATARLGPQESAPITGTYRFEIASLDETGRGLIAAITRLVESGHRVTVLLGDDPHHPAGEDATSATPREARGSAR